jgi:two-component system chemotaxis response regulator CheY
MLTTESETAKRQEARAAGATAWIVKPFRPEQLVNVVQKVLG